jgi:hypothetical protein
MGSLMTVLMGMLGLGGLRSFEKYKGLTKWCGFGWVYLSFLIRLVIISIIVM